MRDPVTRVFDSVLSSEREEATQFFKETDPSVFELPVYQREAIINDTARIFAADTAAQTAGMGSRLKGAFAKYAPETTMDVGVGGATLGNALGLVGMGPKDWRENPVGATASTAAMAASMVPGGALISKLPGSTMKMLGAGVESGLGGPFTVARKAEQIIGPAVAAGTGGGLAQAFEDLNNVPPVPVNTDSKDPVSPASVFVNALERAKKESLFEAKGGLLGLGIALGIKGAGVWARGSEKHFQEATEAMRLAGVRGEAYGLQEVTDNKLIRGASGIIGVMPIPVVSSKFVKAKQRVSGEVGRLESEFLDDASPGFSVFKKLYEADPKRYGRLLEQQSDTAFRAVSAAAQRYGFVRTGISNTVNSLIRSQRVSSAAASTRTTALQQLSSVATRRDLPLTRNAAGQVTNMNVLAGFSPRIQRFLTDVHNIPPGAVPLDRLINLKNQARDALQRINPNNPLSNEERTTLLSVKSAIETDITAAIQAGGSQQLQDEYARLATYDGDWLSLLAGHVDRRAGKVQTTWGNERISEAAGTTFNNAASGVPTAFQRRQGPMDMGDFVDDMLRNAGPQEIREFATLIRESGQAGQESLRLAAARKLDQIFESSKTVSDEGDITVLQAEKIKKFIQGSSGPGGKDERAFWQLMEEAGVPYQRFRAFSTAVDKLWAQFPPNSSKYMARSMILNGGRDPVGKLARMATGGLIGSTAIGAGAASGSMGLGMFMSAFVLDQYSRLATSPKYLQMVIHVVDPQFSASVRAKAFDRLMASTMFRDYVNKERIDAGQAADVMAGALNQAQSADPLQKLTDQATAYFRNSPPQ